MERRDVELVRVPVDEAPAQGAAEDASRPAASVFPTESKKLKRVDEQTIAAVLGGKSTRFFSESELAEKKAAHGERLEDGTFSGKTLTQAIIEQREAREAKFQDTWKQMKLGKNRPLEADEVEFLDGLRAEESEKQRAVRQAEAAALTTFRSRQAGTSTEEHSTPKELRPAPAVKKKTVARPKAVRAVIASVKPAESLAAGNREAAEHMASSTPSQGGSAGLGALLGAYGGATSSSDEDDDAGPN